MLLLYLSIPAIILTVSNITVDLRDLESIQDINKLKHFLEPVEPLLCDCKTVSCISVHCY